MKSTGIDHINIRIPEDGVEEAVGAKGREPGVYIRDPFGYKIELKAQ